MTGRTGTMRVHGLVPLWDAVRPVSPIGLEIANLLLLPSISGQSRASLPVFLVWNVGCVSLPKEKWLECLPD